MARPLDGWDRDHASANERALIALAA